MREDDVEAYLVKRVKELGGMCPKVEWVGRESAPDRVVMLPEIVNCRSVDVPARTIWVELKSPKTIETFPANAHERAQDREHARMRAAGQRVAVIGTIEQVDEMLS
jgi:hypothetical protein